MPTRHAVKQRKNGGPANKAEHGVLGRQGRAQSLSQHCTPRHHKLNRDEGVKAASYLRKKSQMWYPVYNARDASTSDNSVQKALSMTQFPKRRSLGQRCVTSPVTDAGPALAQREEQRENMT